MKQTPPLSDGSITTIGRNLTKSFRDKSEGILPIYVGPNAEITKKDLLEKLAFSTVLGTFRHDKGVDYESAIKHFQKIENKSKPQMVNNINDMLQSLYPAQKCILLIDITDVPYYGEDKRFCKGTSKAKGTKYAHKYLVFQMIGEKYKGFVGYVPIDQLTDVHQEIRQMLQKLANKHIILGIQADREFFNTDDLKAFMAYASSFLTPATRNKGVKPKEEEMKKDQFLFKLDKHHENCLEEGAMSEELTSIFEKHGHPLPKDVQLFEEKEDEWVVSKDGKEYCWIETTDDNLNVYGEGKKIADHRMGVNRKEPTNFNLIRIWNEEKKKHYLFATDLNIPENSVKKFTELYGIRWNIETGFSDKNQFRITTTCEDHVRRVLFFGVSLLMYNIWQIYREEKGDVRKIDVMLAVIGWMFCSSCPYCLDEKKNIEFHDVLDPP